MAFVLASRATMALAAGSRRCGLLIAVAFLCAYLALGQNLMHGYDAYHYMRCVAEGELHYSLHALYLPTAWSWTQLLGAIGVAQYEAMRSLSAIAAAAGVYGCHRAAIRLGLDGERAAMAAIGCASVPAVLYSATVVEIDAVEFGCFGIAWIPFATLLRHNRWSAAVVTGLCTAVAAGFHGAGNLFAASLCGLQLAWGWPGRRLAETAPRALVLAAVHLVSITSIGWLAGSAGQVTMVTNSFGLQFHLDIVLRVMWIEFLLPYLPFGALVLVGVCRRELRASTIVCLVCLAGYLVLTTWIIGFYREEGRFGPQGGAIERGSFLLGLVPPLVLLSVQALPPRLAWTAVALSALSGIVQQRLLDWPADPEGYASGWAEVSAAEPSHVLLADAQEWAWIARRHPTLSSSLIGVIRLQADLVTAQSGQPVPVEYFVTWFGVESVGHHNAGRRFLITDRALLALRASEDANLAAAATQLPTVYAMERVSAGAFAAWSLRLR